MSDAYLEWLGIPTAHRPPNYYQLLGVAPSEQNPEIIKSAAGRQYARVLAHRTASDAMRSERIAEEIVRARDTLLDPVARERYDSVVMGGSESWWKAESGPAVPTLPKVAGWWAEGTMEPPPSIPPTMGAGWSADKPTTPIPPRPSSASTERKPVSLPPSIESKTWWKETSPEPPRPVPSPPLSIAKSAAPLPPSKPVARPPHPVASEKELELVAEGRSFRGSSLLLIVVGLVAVGGTVAGGVYFLTKKTATKEVAENSTNEVVPDIKEIEIVPVPPPPPKKAVPEPEKIDPVVPKVEVEPKKIPKLPPKKIEFAEILAFRGHKEGVLNLALTRSGKSFLSISSDKSVLLHAVSGGGFSRLHKLNSEGVGVALCDDDKEAIFCDGGQVGVYDLGNKKIKYTFFNPSGGLECMTATPDGRYILLGANDGYFRWWNIADNKLEHDIAIDEKSAVMTLALNAKGQTAALGLANGRISTWDLKKKSEIKRWQAHKGRVSSLAVSPDGKRIVSCGEDSSAVVWDAESGEQLQKFAEHRGEIYGVGWCADGRHVITGSVDKNIFQWDAETGRRTEWSAKAEERVFSLAIDAQDRFVLTGQANGIIQLFPMPH